VTQFLDVAAKDVHQLQSVPLPLSVCPCATRTRSNA
jgi:hypothetical protein